MSEFKLGIVGKGKKQNILASVITPNFLVTHVLSPLFGSVLGLEINLLQLSELSLIQCISIRWIPIHSSIFSELFANSLVPSFPKEKPQKIPPSPDLTSPRQKEKIESFDYMLPSLIFD